MLEAYFSRRSILKRTLSKPPHILRFFLWLKHFPNNRSQTNFQFHLGGKLTAPQVTLSKTAVDVAIGTPIDVLCTATGDPDPVLSWERLDGHFSPAIHNHGGLLRINSAAMSDSGHYRCVAANSVGEHDQILSIVVRENSLPPQIYIIPERYDAHEGEDVTLRCETGGHGNVLWIKQGQRELPPRAYARGEVLTIRGIYLEDGGRYICSVNLPGGTVQNGHSEIRVVSTSGPITYVN